VPELPEVEFARSCLSRWLGGKTLRKVEADPTRVIRGASPKAFAALARDRVTKVERRGKWLLWRFASDVGLLAHLGMTGKFEIAPPGTPSVRWSRARFTRSDGAGTTAIRGNLATSDWRPFRSCSPPNRSKASGPMPKMTPFPQAR
jgi:formamidopyrimidine-DNA glycosylase